jgi:hypothetical protein
MACVKQSLRLYKWSTRVSFLCKLVERGRQADAIIHWNAQT